VNELGFGPRTWLDEAVASWGTDYSALARADAGARQAAPAAPPASTAIARRATAIRPANVEVIAPAKPDSGGRVYVPRFEDHLSRFRLDLMTEQTLRAALNNASFGHMRPLADLYRAMRKDPIIGGIYRQHDAGAKRFILSALSPNGVRLNNGSTLRVNLKPADDSELAQTILEETIADSTDQNATHGRLIDSFLKHTGGFGGLTEQLWEFDRRWRVADFVHVPGQRIRFDRNSGEMAFAYSVYDYQGVPVSQFAPGTWVVWDVDKGEPEFGSRGTLAMLINDFWHAAPVGLIWVGAVERWHAPMLHVATDDPDDKQKAIDAGDGLGSQAVIVTSLETTKVTAITGQTISSRSGSPANEFEARCQRRAAIVILGAEQTVSVSQGDGSQQSVDAQVNVREDFLFEKLNGYLEARRRYVDGAAALRNHGVGADSLAPIYELVIQEQVDRAKELSDTKAGEDLGIDRSEKELRAKLGWAEPAPGESVREKRIARGGGQPEPRGATVTPIDRGRNR